MCAHGHTLHQLMSLKFLYHRIQLIQTHVHMHSKPIHPKRTTLRPLQSQDGMGLSSLSSSLARTQGAVGERSKSAIDEKLHRRLCRLPRSAQQQRCMVIALVCMCIVIAMAALQPIFGSLHSLLAAHPASLASRPPTRERHAQRGLSLPERLSAAYLDYMDETQAMQDQAEADETWIMPEECKQMTMEVDSRKTFYSELGQDLFLYKHFFRDGQTSDGRKRFFLDIGKIMRGTTEGGGDLWESRHVQVTQISSTTGSPGSFF